MRQCCGSIRADGDIYLLGAQVSEECSGLVESGTSDQILPALPPVAGLGGTWASVTCDKYFLWMEDLSLPFVFCMATRLIGDDFSTVGLRIIVWECSVEGTVT
jgi:hypothetical protein